MDSDTFRCSRLHRFPVRIAAFHVHRNISTAAFQRALDAFGPLDILNTLALKQGISLSVIAWTLDPVSTKPPSEALQLPPGFNFAQSIVPTHTFSDPPQNLDVLIIPGGIGAHTSTPEVLAAIAFIKDVFPKLGHLFTVCTGSSLAARAGVLDGRNATSNKVRPPCNPALHVLIRSLRSALFRNG